MKFTRLFSKPGVPVRDQIQWEIRESKVIDGKTGETVFHMPQVEVPESWSQNATNILAQKYFRKAGVPSGVITNSKFHPHDWERDRMPVWLLPKTPTEGCTWGSEFSAHQVFDRMAGCWTYWGWKEKLITTEEDARIFYDELYMMLALQVAAPNSPQWFNTGLHWAYGIEGPDSGQWTIDNESKQLGTEPNVYQIPNSYVRPQPHACFIQTLNDDLVNEGGIMDLAVREARLFKHGSGTGSNFSKLRGKGEKLSGGGSSSGLMSFLSIGDVVAGSIASGGTTRRAAKMVVVDVDHPEIEEFIDWKVREEAKAAAMAVGSRVIREYSQSINKHGEVGTDAKECARRESIPEAMIDRAKIGIIPDELDLSFEGPAMSSVDGQNSNNSVRITDDFMEKLKNNEVWTLRGRLDGKATKSLPSAELWSKICRAAWACADPGLQFHTTINKWNTCKADGDINASNPCSEYMFLDDTACNLASLNLVAFKIDHPLSTNNFNYNAFEHATRLWTVVLEISVFMASFPSKAIALRSHLYRTLGLGYANLGGLLMRFGIPYDSDEGRDLARGLTALMTGVAGTTSAEMATEIGPFPRWEANKSSMLAVINMHQDEAAKISGELGQHVWSYWSELGRTDSAGFRNAQWTLIAPTGTIAFVMDCDTTGIEPDFALKKFKKLSGKGDMEIASEAVPEALHRLGYKPHEINLILGHVRLFNTVEHCNLVKPEHLAVFDCANPPDGFSRCLRWESHILMMAAVQPFLSGAISKTANMPRTATVADVSAAYTLAWELGLKSVAIYRDGSKLNQPLSSSSGVKAEPPLESDPANRYMDMMEKKDTTQSLARGQRRSMPNRRRGYRQKVKIGDQTMYHSTGEWDDNQLGEIFEDLGREGGAFVRSIMQSFAKSVSLGLQYGVPLEEFVEAFIYTNFEPSGFVTGHEHIRFCSSVVDFIFRDLAISYLGRMDLANVRPEEKKSEGLDPILYDYAKIVSKEYTPRSTNEMCPQCHNLSLVRTGTCRTCTNCPYNEGCG